MLLPAFLLAASATADFTPPRIPPAAATSRWGRLLRNEVRYLVAAAPPGPVPNELEHAIRPLTSTALSAAVCSVLGACPPADGAEAAAVRILRDVTRTHLTGGGSTATGRPWGHQWQSALWAWQAAFAGWLLGDRLPPDLRRAVVAMTVDEADRFIDLPPPYAEFLDTKAEENAWNSLILVLASEALPAHPHRARWRDRGLQYMISAFATRADRRNPTLIDGRLVRDWVAGANIHDDYTLENHGFVHPDYMSTVWLNLSNAVTYRLAGHPVPQAPGYHAREVYRNLKWLTLPDGGLFYPNGTDWNLHRIDMAAGLHVAMERVLGDPDAGALAGLGLATLEKMQARNPDGRTFVPGEFPSYPSHESQSGWTYATSLLFEALWPPPAKTRPAAAVWRSLQGGRLFDDGRFFVLRAPGALSSFSWGLRIMGQTVPFAADPILRPLNHSYIGTAGPLAPDNRPGYTGIGSLAVEAAIARDAVTLSTVIPGSEAGAFHVTASARHGTLSQVFSFTALPGGRSVYMERWRGQGAEQALGGLVSLLREPRWVYGAAERRIAGDGKTWLNVDGRLGFAVSGGGGIRVIPDGANSTLVALDAAPSADAVIVTLPNADAAATAAFAQSAFRLPVRHPGIAAVLIDGFLVATNFSPHPLTVEAEVHGKTVPIPVNGISTRVLRYRDP